MADNTLPERDEYTPGIYQLETDDPVLGGEDGISNLQGKQLANRTTYLRNRLNELNDELDANGATSELSTDGYSTADIVTGVSFRDEVTQSLYAVRLDNQGQYRYSLGSDEGTTGLSLILDNQNAVILSGLAQLDQGFSRGDEVYVSNQNPGSLTTTVTEKKIGTVIDDNETVLMAKEPTFKVSEGIQEFLRTENMLDARSVLGLGNASTRNIGLSSGNVLVLTEDVDGNPALPEINAGGLKGAVVNEEIKTPSITSPSDGAGNLDPAAFSLDGSVFSPLYSTYTRDYREFQIRLQSSDWTNLEVDTQQDSDSLSVSLTDDTSYVARIRDVDTDGRSSDWSVEVSFNTSSVYVENPTLTVEGSPDDVPVNPDLSTSSFSMYGMTTSDATHVSTNWKVEDLNGNVVWSSFNDSDNLLSITVPSSILDRNTTYTFMAQHNSDSWGSSSWSTVEATTRDVYVEQPVVSVETRDGAVPRTPVITTDSFSINTTDESDHHLNTDWRVKNSDGNVIWSELNSSNRTEIEIPENVLAEGNTYTFEVRHRGETYGSSDWGTNTNTTVSEFSYVEQPSAIYPTSSDAGVDGTVTLESDAFSVYQDTDTHINTEYKIIKSSTGDTIYNKIIEE